MVLCGDEVVRVFAPTAAIKARELYLTLFHSAGMGRSICLVDAWMDWEYFVSPPVEWERVYAIMKPNGKVSSLHRTLQSAEKTLRSYLAPSFEFNLTIREMIMEW